MRMPSRPITQNTGTRANTAYSAVFSSAECTAVLLAAPTPAPPDPAPPPRALFPALRRKRTRDAVIDKIQ